MLFKYYRCYSTFRNIFNTLVSALLISTIVLSLLLTMIFSTLSINQTNEISTRMLSRLVFMTEQVYDKVYSVLLSLGYGENIDINTMMFGNSRDRLRDYSGYTRMRLLQTIYPDIAYIGVYNGKLDEIMCTVGLEADTVAAIRHNILDNYTKQGSRILIPMNNQRIVMEGYDPNLNTLTLIYYSPLSKTGQVGAIFCAIDCNYLSRFISSINENDHQLTFLVDSKGTVLSHPATSQILTDYSGKDYVHNPISSQKPSGYFYTDYRGERTLVTYLRGTNLDWTYITLTPYTDILKKINSVYIVTIITSLLIVVIGAMFSLFATQRTFNPIAKLLIKAGYSTDEKIKNKTDEIKYLDDRFSHYIKASSTNEALLMNYALESLLKGELSEETADLLRQNQTSLHAPYYIVCLLYISRTSNYRDLARKDKNYMQFTLSKITEECLAPICIGTHAVNVSSTSAAMIIQLPSGAIPKGMVLALVEAQQVFAKHFSLEFSAAVSGIYEDFYASQDAFEEAAQLMTERFFIGENSILVTQDRHITNANYNQRLENQIWCAIQNIDDEEITRTVRLFIEELRALSYKYARLYISQLTINILGYSLALLPQMEMEQLNVIKRNLDNLETLDQSHDELLNLCRQIASQYNNHEDSDNHHSVDHAILLARDHYMDSTFSTNTAAQIVGLSIIYFNRIFKKKIGQSYSTYLSKVRLKMACTLLHATNLSMNKICSNVGLSNESYFYALFKKEYGITPYQYRKQHNLKE